MKWIKGRCFNPLNRVIGLSTDWSKAAELEREKSFNPLNRVIGLSTDIEDLVREAVACFNPLNRVIGLSTF